MPILKRNLTSLCLGMCLLSSSGAFAWNALGHGVIADIAYSRLKPDVKNKVDHLVAYFHSEYPEMHSFQQTADWPDQVRAQHITTYTHWHYIDIGFSNDGTPVKDEKDTDNAVWAINNIKDVVKNNRANPYEHARFLAFLAHIVGDLHQPLHTVTQFSSKHPEGDRGGNLFPVRYQHERRNLHFLWDQGLGLFDEDNTPENTDQLSKTIMAHYPESYFGNKVHDLNLDDWTREGMDNAKQYVYTTQADQEPDENYLQAGKKIVEQQTALAGYRLAYMLNQLLAD